MDLSTAANIAEILGGLTVIGGAIFAIIEVREFRAHRRQDIAVEICRSFHEPGLVDAINLMRELPDGIEAEELRSRGPEYERAAIMICTTYESIALLVFRDLASMSLVRELTGGITVVLWRKLSKWMETIREENEQPSWAEWFQWLAEQFMRNSSLKEANPAYIRHADWRARVE